MGREIANLPSSVGEYEVTENKLLLPIPQGEVNLDNLKKNDP